MLQFSRCAETFDANRDRLFGHRLRLIRSITDAEDVTAMVSPKHAGGEVSPEWSREQDTITLSELEQPTGRPHKTPVSPMHHDPEGERVSGRTADSWGSQSL